MTVGDDPHTGQAATDTRQAAHGGAGPVVIGFWKSSAEPYWPDVNDFVDQTWDPAVRAAVADRLRAGREVQGIEASAVSDSRSQRPLMQLMVQPDLPMCGHPE